MPRLFVIGGPNGSGKTTAAMGLLPEILGCDEFVNADAVARALSPFNPERVAWKAGRLTLEAVHELAEAGRDFAFETTLASRSFAPFLRRCQSKGYGVTVVFCGCVRRPWQNGEWQHGCVLGDNMSPAK
jgi:predicted ABC-type ATPase